MTTEVRVLRLKMCCTPNQHLARHIVAPKARLPGSLRNLINHFWDCTPSQLHKYNSLAERGNSLNFRSRCKGSETIGRTLPHRWSGERATSDTKCEGSLDHRTVLQHARICVGDQLLYPCRLGVNPETACRAVVESCLHFCCRSLLEQQIAAGAAVPCLVDGLHRV